MMVLLTRDNVHTCTCIDTLVHSGLWLNSVIRIGLQSKSHSYTLNGFLCIVSFFHICTFAVLVNSTLEKSGIHQLDGISEGTGCVTNSVYCWYEYSVITYL